MNKTLIIFGMLFSLLFISGCVSPSDKIIKNIARPSGLIYQYRTYVIKDTTLDDTLKNSRVTNADSILLAAKRLNQR